MKIYTKTGDEGTTGLFGGRRVSKDAPRIEAYGDVDELNTHIGFVRSLAEIPSDIDNLLARIQRELFVLGADLATPDDKERKNLEIPRVTSEFVACLEEDIDRFEAELPPLKSFILPGGGPTGSALHVARTVCRRSERRVVSLREQDRAVSSETLIYLNRLSDLLFVLARVVNHRSGQTEEAWRGG